MNSAGQYIGDKDLVPEFLKGVDLFDGISDADINRLVTDAREIVYNPGEIILGEGKIATALFIILSGSVEGILKDKHGIENRILSLSRGECFPLKPLLTETPCLYNFKTIQVTHVLLVPNALFLELFSSSPSLRKSVLVHMLEREGMTTLSLLAIKKLQKRLMTMIRTIEEEAPFLVGKTLYIKGLWENIPRLASDDAPVLIKGEFGAGKELIAEILHWRSPLKDKPFIIIDAYDISERDWMDFLEGEGSKIFRGGTFGFLAYVSGGTILLKNVDALSQTLQNALKRHLLSVHRSKSIQVQGKRVGEEEPGRGFNDGGTPVGDENFLSRVDTEGLQTIKLLFTTRRDLDDLVKKGEFDPELCDLITKNVIYLPPLRQRKSDILELAQFFIIKYSKHYKKPVVRLSHRAKEQLLHYDYLRGNIQELEDIIKRGVTLATTDTLRSENLFLGEEAGKAHVLYNLLRIKCFAKMVKKGLYPGVFKWIAVFFFFFIMFSCFFGNQDPVKNPGTILVWWMWWPFLCFGAFWIGRTWCSFCAYATIGRIFQRVINLRLRFPRILKDYDYLVAIFIFLFVVWAEEASGMREHPVYTGVLLFSILSIEIIFSIFFQRDIWCRHVCPMGNLVGVFAMSSILEVRADLNICENQCTTDECYHGSGRLDGCPMFQHLRFVDNNQTCKLCLNCIRVCPHKAVSLNLRPPGWEIWESNQVRPGMAFFLFTLMAVLFPVIKPVDAFVLNIMAYILAPVAMIGIIWIISIISFRHLRGKTYEGFWRTSYAYVPLALAAHIAYQVRYLPWLRDLEYFVFYKNRIFLTVSSLPRLIQILSLLLGLTYSIYAISRIKKRHFSDKMVSSNSYWIAHLTVMVIYPLLILFVLG